MRLFMEALDREVAELHENGVRLRFVGALDRLSESLRAQMANAENTTCDNTGLKLNVAVAYGGRWDIVNAVRKAADDGLDISALSEEQLQQRLAIGDCPEPDLLIRTGGEVRISNFLLWQLAYSELYFTDGLWPDFDDAQFDKAIAYYAGRQRRIGRTSEQVREA